MWHFRHYRHKLSAHKDDKCFEDIACLGDSSSLSEISLDGNPITQEQYYKQIVLRHMQQLKQLDMKRVTAKVNVFPKVLPSKLLGPTRELTALPCPHLPTYSSVITFRGREEERRIALVMARKEEEKKRDVNKAAVMKEKKRLAINNAKRQWELMQGSMMGQTGKLVKMPELYANHVGTVPNSEIVTPLYDGDEIIEVESINSEKQSSRGGSRPSSAHSSTIVENTERPKTSSGTNNKKTELTKSGQLKETILFGQGDSRTGDIGNLADLEGDTLTLYGNQSLEALERNWGMQAAGAVSKVIFKFIDFDEIARHLHKIRTRFPGVQSLVFTATNIKSLHQINALSNVRRIDNLTINPEGNPITKFTLWRMYLLFRLAHFALKKINDVEITAGDIVNAEKLFGPISHITTSQMPQSRLLSLLGETRRKQLLAMSDEKSKKVLEGKLDKSQGEFVGRSGLTYQTPDSLSSKQQDSSNKKAFAKSYINEIAKEAIFTDRKRNELLKLWPQIFYELVCGSVTEMSDIQTYMKRCMEDLEKS